MSPAAERDARALDVAPHPHLFERLAQSAKGVGPVEPGTDHAGDAKTTPRASLMHAFASSAGHAGAQQCQRLYGKRQWPEKERRQPLSCGVVAVHMPEGAEP